MTLFCNWLFILFLFDRLSGGIISGVLFSDGAVCDILCFNFLKSFWRIIGAQNTDGGGEAARFAPVDIVYDLGGGFIVDRLVKLLFILTLGGFRLRP